MHTEDVAGDVDYSKIGGPYKSFRVPDPRIAAAVHAQLGSARRVLNVGAGTGSYEPLDRIVTAVEPSAAMRAQRGGVAWSAIDATAEDLPFADKSFDAAMSTFSIHQWGDLHQGLRELRRVTTGPIVLLTCDPRLVENYWLNDYVPDVLNTEARRYPTMEALAQTLGSFDVQSVPVPLDCTDGFNEAYYGRPEMFLEPAARLSCSAWSFVAAEAAAEGVSRLRSDLASGAWDSAHGDLRAQPQYHGSLVLATA